MSRIKLTLAVLLVLLILGLGWLVAQDGIAEAGTGWVAKRTCSGVFVANRPVHSLPEANLPLPIPISIPAVINPDVKRVTARMFGRWSPSTARYLPKLGCTLEGPADRDPALHPNHDLTGTRKMSASPLPVAQTSDHYRKAIEFAFPASEPGVGTRAVVVLERGTIVAERYAEGFSATTRLPGWSMTKSVTNAIVGLLVAQGRIDIMTPVGLPEWASKDDPRREITWDHLLRMSSGLKFSENYIWPGSDAIQMLFGTQRHAKGRYAASLPLEFAPDTHWSYSSGTTNVLQYALLEQIFDGDVARYLDFPHRALFEPIGMKTAVLEPDASGVYVGSSFMYATARDWSRFGQLFLDRGRHKGQRLLSEEWVRYSATPTHTNTRGRYGAHWWLNAEAADGGSRHMPTLAKNLLIASGFEGQTIVIVPNHDLVIVRLGLDRGTQFPLEPFVAGVISAAESHSESHPRGAFTP